MATPDYDLTEVPALFTLDGALAATHYGYNEWGGREWRLDDRTTSRLGTRYLRPSRATKQSTRDRYYRARGLNIRMVRPTAPIEERRGGTYAPLLGAEIVDTHA